MSDAPGLFSDLTFTAAGPAERSTGLLGWLHCRYGLLIIDGIGVRRTLDGRLTISFPERRDRAGRAHAVVRPIDARARAAIEGEILQGIPGVQGGRP